MLLTKQGYCVKLNLRRLGMVKKINSRLENGVHNYEKVFNLIIEKTAISRTEICNLTGLSPSSVTNITNKLISNKLVKESELIMSEGVGRKAVLLRLNPFGGFFCILTFIDGSIRLDFYDLERKLQDTNIIPKQSDVITAEFLIEKIEEEVQYNYKYGRFFGVVMVVPTKMLGCDRQTLLSEFGYAIDENCIAGLKHFYKNTEIFMESVCAMNAYSMTMRDSKKCVLNIEMDKSISLSLLSGNTFFTPKHFSCGIKNSIVNDNGEMLKDYLTSKSICGKYEQLTSCKKSIKEILSLYDKGDEIAKKLIDKSIAVGVKTFNQLAETLNVDYLLIGGGLVVNGKQFATNLIKELKNKLFNPKIKLILADDYENASSGAVKYAFENSCIVK